MTPGPRVNLYSDFNCPYCYALHERLHSLGAQSRIAWRGVQHARFLPVPMVPWLGRLQSELRHEVETVVCLAPEVPIRLPSGKPNTGAAIALAVRAMRTDARQADVLIRALYRAFWIDGVDLSDRDVLRMIAMPIGLTDDAADPDEEADVRNTMACWEEAWQEKGSGAVPLLAREDGERILGLAGPGELTRFVDGTA